MDCVCCGRSLAGGVLILPWEDGDNEYANRCQICGSNDHVEGHHIIDHQFGGAADKDNIVALCHKHHNDVHKGLIGLLKI